MSSLTLVDNAVQNLAHKSVNESVCNSCGATRGQEDQIYPKIIKGFLVRNTSLIRLLVQSS